jgi:hypothetical protein
VVLQAVVGGKQQSAAGITAWSALKEKSVVTAIAIFIIVFI